MPNSHLRPIVPATEKRTVTPKRAKNSELRTREYLTEHEVETLMAAARKNRHGHRDATMILIAFRHGLRASEVVDLRWDQVDFNRAVLHVRRAKAGTPSVHPLTGSEMRTLRRLQPHTRPHPLVQYTPWPRPLRAAYLIVRISVGAE
jgi:integrase